jgi:hypothetical protein
MSPKHISVPLVLLLLLPLAPPIRAAVVNLTLTVDVFRFVGVLSPLIAPPSSEDKHSQLLRGQR